MALNGSEFLGFCLRLDPSRFNTVVNLISELKSGREFNIFGEVEPQLGLATADFISYISYHYPVMSVAEIKQFYMLNIPSHLQAAMYQQPIFANTFVAPAAPIQAFPAVLPNVVAASSGTSVQHLKAKSDTSEDKSPVQVFVGGLLKTAAKEPLVAFVKKHAPGFIDLQLKQGFAFVTYRGSKDARDAIEILRSLQFEVCLSLAVIFIFRAVPLQLN